MVTLSFSPRNGESVLKVLMLVFRNSEELFQSPQWGKCSKVAVYLRNRTQEKVSVPAMGKVF